MDARLIYPFIALCLSTVFGYSQAADVEIEYDADTFMLAEKHRADEVATAKKHRADEEAAALKHRADEEAEVSKRNADVIAAAAKNRADEASAPPNNQADKESQSAKHRADEAATLKKNQADEVALQLKNRAEEKAKAEIRQANWKAAEAKLAAQHVPTVAQRVAAQETAEKLRRAEHDKASKKRDEAFAEAEKQRRIEHDLAERKRRAAHAEAEKKRQATYSDAEKKQQAERRVAEENRKEAHRIAENRRRAAHRAANEKRKAAHRAANDNRDAAYEKAKAKRLGSPIDQQTLDSPENSTGTNDESQQAKDSSSTKQPEANVDSENQSGEGPVIQGIEPKPIFGFNQPQIVKIIGDNFEGNLDVSLQDMRTGETFPNREIISKRSDLIVLRPNFTAHAAPWKVRISTPDANSISKTFTVQPLTVRAPVQGAFRVTGTENANCMGASGLWTFCQHQTQFHAPGRRGGIAGSIDNLAWDMNLLGDKDNEGPVYAVADGHVVKYAGAYSPGERSGAVLIEHKTNGVTWWSAYLHMKNNKVRLGDAVSANTIVGNISNVCDGCGGDTIPNHLHFVVYEGSNTNNGLISRNVAFQSR